MFGSKGREPEKERNTNMEFFHVINPFFLNVFTKVEVYDFKPLAKSRILW